MKKIEDTSFGDTIQYLLGFVILFLIGMLALTGDFKDIILLILGIIVIQILISIIRFKMLHIILEVILLILGAVTLIAFIPLFLFKILAWLVLIPMFILGMLDLISFKSKGMYSQVYMRTSNFGFNSKKQSKKKDSQTLKKKKAPSGVVDADFKEK